MLWWDDRKIFSFYVTHAIKYEDRRNFDFLFNNLVVIFQSLSCVQPFTTPWTAAHQASLPFSISWTLLKLMSIESVMPSSYLILCRFLLLLIILAFYKSLNTSHGNFSTKNYLKVFTSIIWGIFPILYIWSTHNTKHSLINSYLNCFNRLLTDFSFVALFHFFSTLTSRLLSEK